LITRGEPHLHRRRWRERLSFWWSWTLATVSSA